jgi:hypothetical protein
VEVRQADIDLLDPENMRGDAADTSVDRGQKADRERITRIILAEELLGSPS